MEWLESEGVEAVDRELVATVDLRYIGQNCELNLLVKIASEDTPWLPGLICFGATAMDNGLQITGAVEITGIDAPPNEQRGKELRHEFITSYNLTSCW